MNELLEKRALQLLADYRPYHSEFQIDNFIVRSGGENSWMLYKQALREIHSRIDTLDANQFEREELEIDLEELGAAKVEGIAARRRDLQARRKERRWDALSAQAKDLERELQRFVEIAEGLKRRFGEITEEKRATWEAEAWAQRAKELAAVDGLVLNGLPLSKGTLDLVLAMPVLEREKIISVARQPATLMRRLMAGVPLLSEGDE